MSGVLIALITVSAAGLGGSAKLLIDRRRSSGTIDHSEAGDLWREGTALREFLQEQRSELESKVDRLEKRVDRLTDANDGLRLQLEQAHQLVLLLRTEREALTAELDRARAWADVLVAELKHHDLDLPQPPPSRTSAGA